MRKYAEVFKLPGSYFSVLLFLVRFFLGFRGCKGLSLENMLLAKRIDQKMVLSIERVLLDIQLFYWNDVWPNFFAKYTQQPSKMGLETILKHQTLYL